MRSLELAPESFISRLARSTLLSKTENRIPLRGLYSVQNGSFLASRARMPASHRIGSVCPRNLSNITRRVADCQPTVPTGFPPVFHIGELRPKRELLKDSNARLPLSRPRKPKAADRSVRATRQRKSLNLRKDHLEVVATNAKPFEEPCPRMTTPWPGLISELFSLLYYF